MMKEDATNGSKNWARVCDKCRSAACTVYCRADSAYLCAGCDAGVHEANSVASRHERVLVCEGCERAPAAFICKADAASLCASCDADIHSANPLARRHHRVPVLPISGCVYGPSSTATAASAAGDDDDDDVVFEDNEEEDETASWLLLNPMKNQGNNNNNVNNVNGSFLFGGEVDEYLDLVEYNNSSTTNTGDHENHHRFGDHDLIHNQHMNSYGVPHKSSYGGGGGGDSIVPVKYICGDGIGKGQIMTQQSQQGFQLDLEFDSPKGAYSTTYNGSISHSVSVSSMDVSVVPDSTMSDISISHPRRPKGMIDLFSGPPLQTPTQLSPMDREARVLRYREKKKARKFEKTIRYASRKAYAETRPRIKGRFAKRTDVEVEVDQMFATTLMAETGYGIVPSF